MTYNGIKKYLLWIMIFYIPVYIILFFILNFLYTFFLGGSQLSEAGVDANSLFISYHIFVVCVFSAPLIIYGIIVLLKNKKKIENNMLIISNSKTKNIAILLLFILIPALSLGFMYLFSNPSIAYKQGISLHEEGKYIEALPNLEIAYNHFPSNVTIYLLVDTLKQIGEKQEALNYLAFVNYDVSDSYFVNWVYMMQGDLLLGLHKTTDAIDNYDRAIAFNEKQGIFKGYFFYKRGAALYSLGLHEQAFSSYLLAIDEGFDHDYALLDLGLTALINKDSLASYYFDKIQLNTDASDLLDSNKNILLSKKEVCYPNSTGGSYCHTQDETLENAVNIIYSNKLSALENTVYDSEKDTILSILPNKLNKSVGLLFTKFDDINENESIVLYDNDKRKKILNEIITLIGDDVVFDEENIIIPSMCKISDYYSVFSENMSVVCRSIVSNQTVYSIAKNEILSILPDQLKGPIYNLFKKIDIINQNEIVVGFDNKKREEKLKAIVSLIKKDIINNGNVISDILSEDEMELVFIPSMCAIADYYSILPGILKLGCIDL